MVYKMPIVKDNSTAGVDDGYGFYYMDARSNGKWQPSPKTLLDNDQVRFLKRPSVFHTNFVLFPLPPSSTLFSKSGYGTQKAF